MSLANVTIGTPAAFDSKNQTWEEYCEIMEQFFAANQIEDADRQRAILISVVGASTYSLMRSLLRPDKPKDKTYSELVSLLKNHFDPKPSEIVQRYKFDSRHRKCNESVMEYVAELRRLAQDCNYGDTLQQMLRDRIVCGINDDRIQRLLLAEADLTFDKAVSISVAAESANKNARDLRNPRAPAKRWKGSREAGAFKGAAIESYHHTESEWCRPILESRSSRTCRSDVMVRPQTRRRQHIPRTRASAAIVRRLKVEDPGALSDRLTEAPSVELEVGASSNKRKRCDVCGPKMDRKTQYTCIKCEKYICNTHTVKLCPSCVV